MNPNNPNTVKHNGDRSMIENQCVIYACTNELFVYANYYFSRILCEKNIILWKKISIYVHKLVIDILLAFCLHKLVFCWYKLALCGLKVHKLAFCVYKSLFCGHNILAFCECRLKFCGHKCGQICTLCAQTSISEHKLTFCVSKFTFCVNISQKCILCEKNSIVHKCTN